MGALEAVCV